MTGRQVLEQLVERKSLLPRALERPYKEYVLNGCSICEVTQSKGLYYYGVGPTGVCSSGADLDDLIELLTFNV